MELCSLHPFEEARVRDFVASVLRADSAGDRVIGDAVTAIGQIRRGEPRGGYGFTFALGRYLSAEQPVFAHEGISLTTWEARVDRGAGMLLRPPARLFIDAGLDPVIARTLPIRLELSRGMMGGAYVPARLTGEFERLLEIRLERSVRRLIDAEFDGIAVMGLMLELASYARSNDLAIFEALDVVSSDATVPGVPAGRVITADTRRLDKSIRIRLEQAARPAKKPGLLARLAARGKHAGDDRGAGQESAP